LALLKIAGGFSDDTARTIARVGPDAPPAASVGPGTPPPLPGGALPDTPPPVTDESLRSTGSPAEDWLISTARTLGETECEVVEYIAGLDSPPTFGGLVEEYAPDTPATALWRATQLYDAAVAVGDGGATLQELNDLYCAANP
jgi:hypothetical protein